jgi:metal-responsive CopG/Arc/MetJ family transcriptional regulator
MWVRSAMLKTKPVEKKTRITVDFTSDFYKRLEELERLVEAESKASLIREALQLYAYIAQKVKEGYTFKMRKGAEEQEIVFFRLTS